MLLKYELTMESCMLVNHGGLQPGASNDKNKITYFYLKTKDLI